MVKKIRVGFISLGCSKNTIDTEMMLAHVKKAGMLITPDAKKADVVVINTCGFIRDATQESIDAIAEAAALRKDGKLKKLIVTGCLAERAKERLAAEHPEIDVVAGIGEIHNIAKLIVKAFEQPKLCAFSDYEQTPLGGERILTNAPHFAFMRISEGCNSRCSYCAIPAIRGKYRSRPMEELIEEARFLEKQGVKELNIIAEDTSCYGVDLYGRLALPDLLRKLSAETEIPWFRIFYCYPEKITDDLVAEIRANPRVLHYLDMPVQHINDDVLKRMNRRGGRALIESVIAKLRREIPDMVIRSTGIVGFPGETEEQFNEFLDFIADGAFDRFGAFAYSREENTPAAEMPDQIDEDVKLDRYEALMGAQADVSFAAQQKCIGKTYDVLVECFDDEHGLYAGRNYANGPDVDGMIFFSAGKELSSGDFVRVTIDEADDYDLYGTADV